MATVFPHQTAIGASDGAETSATDGAQGTATADDATSHPGHERSEARGWRLLAPLRWLGRKLTQLVSWAARRLATPLLRRSVARRLPRAPLSLRYIASQIVRAVATHLPAPLRWLVSLLDPGREHGFGFWWLVATIAIAVALGLVVALLLSPVAALIALLVVAIWLLVRARRHTQDDCDNDRSRAPPCAEPSVMCAEPSVM